MDSESARMSSAAEARFRVDYPNSKPRAVKVVALDAASQRVVKRLAERSWHRATFFTSIKFEGAPRSGESWAAWLSDLAGRTKALIIGGKQQSDEELSKTLATLRPYASMLVVASSEDYIEEMLSALRA